MTTLKRFWTRTAAAVQSLFLAGAAYAQTSGGGGLNVDIHTTTSRTMWYGQWWVWAVGIAVFLIIVIALTSRGGRSAT